MAEHTFTNWLQFEVHAARCALLRLYEEEERLKHIEGPQLEKAYMDKFSEFALQFLKEKIEEAEDKPEEFEAIRQAYKKRDQNKGGSNKVRISDSKA